MQRTELNRPARGLVSGGTPTPAMNATTGRKAMRPSRRHRCSGRAVAMAVLFLLGLNSLVRAAERHRPESPALVIRARSLAQLVDRSQKLLAIGAPERAPRFRAVLELLNGLQGVDHHAPLGLLIYLPEETDQAPDAILCVPVESMEDLQQSLAGIGKGGLVRRQETDWWDLRLGERTLPIRAHAGYAYVATREVSLAGPLPPVETWIVPDVQHDLLVTFRADGVPSRVRNEALEAVHRDAARYREQRPGETDATHAFRARLSIALERLIEQVLIDFQSITAGIRFGDAGELDLEVTLESAPDSPLGALLGSLGGGPSRFAPYVDADAPLAVSLTWNLTGEAREIVVDGVRHVRNEIESRMRKDGSADGPAADAIRRLLDAFDATAAEGVIDGLILFAGDRPGDMLLLTAIGLSAGDDAAAALQDLLPLVARTPAVSGLELEHLKLDGLNLHRVTPTEVRKQDQWLYGPDAALHLGAGRGALWLAFGGDARTEALERRLKKRAGPLPVSSPLLWISFHMGPWLHQGALGGREAAWLPHARAAMQGGKDRLQFELTAAPGQLRARVILDEGYIRLLGTVWGGRESGNPRPGSTLAAPRSTPE